MHDYRKTETPGLFLAALVIIQVFCIMLVVKWKAGTAKNEELRKLDVLAAKETAVVEAEYMTNSSTVTTSPHECAVCFSAAARRCSRCKTVRYCSGKCQIMHWRQGHKEECQPPDIYSSSSVSCASTPKDERDLSVSSLEAQKPRPLEINLDRQRTSAPTIQTLDPNSLETPELSASKVPEDSLLKISHEDASEISDPEDVNVVGSVPEPIHMGNILPRALLSSVHLSTCRSASGIPTMDAPGIGIPTSEISVSDFPTSCRVDSPKVLISVASSSKDAITSIFESVHPLSDVSSTKISLKDEPLSMISASSLPVSKSCREDLPVPSRSLDCVTSFGIPEHDFHGTTCLTQDHSRFHGSMLEPHKPRSPSNSPLNVRSPVCGLPISKSRSPFHLSSRTRNHSMDVSRPRNSIYGNPSNISVLDEPQCRSFADDISNPGISVFTSPNLHSYVSDSCSGRFSPSSDDISSFTDRTYEFQSSMPNELNSLSNTEIQSPRASCTKGTIRRTFSSAIRYFSRHRVRASSCPISSQNSGGSNAVSSFATVPVDSSHQTSSCFKRSVRKVLLERPKSAKASKQTAPRVTNQSIAKPSKILFPYEYFVKLFSWSTLELYPCGLINCGNSCYANVVLQCLTYTRPLTAYLLQGYHSEDCRSKDWCFMCELEHLVLRTREGESPLSPIRILSQIQNITTHLGSGRQEDAHELLRLSIDTMQSICLDEAGGEKVVDSAMQKTTFIQQMFGGYLQSKVQCMRCHKESVRYESMLDLTVEMHGNIESLEDALAQFTASELLDGENKYKCDSCKSYVKARKRLIVHEAPNILTIALKRFKNGKFGKLNKHVTFPEVLDMSPYMSGTGDEPPLYLLYAVVVHLDMLNASFSGHYVCYVKDLQGSWYKIDDTEVMPVELHTVMAEGAYMLLYARSSPRPPSVINDGIIQDSTEVPINQCVYDAEQSFLVNGEDGSFIMHATQFSLLNSCTTGKMDEMQFPIAWYSNDYASNVDPSDDIHLGDYDFSNYSVPSVTRTWDMNSFPIEYSDLTSNDAGSLFSGSDEASWTTESNRDSTSTMDYSEIIFG
eukprot:Gb_05817 [translate_table: standard]